MKSLVDNEVSAAIVFTIHGSIEEIERKVGGELNRVSEFLILKKYAEKFDKIFVFSDDKKDYSYLFPENSYHVKLYNPFFYIMLGWAVLLFYTLKYRIKVIHLVGSPALPLVFMINKISQTKVVLDYNYLWHVSYIHDKNLSLVSKLRKNNIIGFIVKRLEKFFVNTFVDYIMLGTEEARVFIKNKHKIMPIKKGIILQNFDPNSVSTHKIFEGKKNRIILFVGRLVKMKDPLTLINAFKIVKKNKRGVSLIICGDGELKETCKKISDGDIYFLGFVDNIPSILKVSDIYVHPSIYDPSPRSLLEAMAMGKPCIATKVGSIEYYLKDCGMLVEPQDPKILAEKIIYLFENPATARKLGIKARKKILREHDLEKNIEKELGIVLR